jgi:hypothetical protein
MSRRCRKPDLRTPEEKELWEEIRRILKDPRGKLRQDAGGFHFRGRGQEVPGIRAEPKIVEI